MLEDYLINIITRDMIMNEEKNNNTFLSLKEKREALGLTLKDIFQRTRITVINLEAIENGNLHLLPVPIYTRNFIRTYAHTLGIDSKPLIESYANYLSSLQIAETPSPENISFLSKIGQYKAYLWTAAGLIFIVIISLFISSRYQPATDISNNLAGKIEVIDQEKKADTISPSPQATVTMGDQEKTIPQTASNETNKIKQIPVQSNASRQEITATEPRASSAQSTRALAESGEVSLLIIQATEETWIRIKADQNPSYQVLLQPGEKIERKAASFDMDIGNAGGIKIQFKGKNIENLGKPGQVIHLRLP